jgi:hypothetical protein
MSRIELRGAALAVAVCTVTLVISSCLKSGVAGCGDGVRWRTDICYTDVYPLYAIRGLDRGQVPYLDAFNEYPPLTGGLMWLTALPVGDAQAYLDVNMLVLGIAGLIAAGLLGDLGDRRALLFSASPVLALYAFHNWDLAAVLAMVTGVWCWARGRPGWAGVSLGIGACLKLFPALLLPALIAERLAAGDRRGAARAGIAAAAVALAVNLPLAVADPSGWWAPFRFQSARLPGSSATVWSRGLPHLSTHVVNAVALALVVVCAAALVALAVRRGRGYLGAGAATLCVAVAVAKLGSPQYALWVLPLFALLRVRLGWWIAFTAVEWARWQGTFAVGWAGLSLGTADDVARLAVWGRAALLLALAIAFARAPEVYERRNILRQPGPSSSGGSAEPAAASRSEPRSTVVRGVSGWLRPPERIRSIRISLSVSKLRKRAPTIV